MPDQPETPKSNLPRGDVQIIRVNPRAEGERPEWDLATRLPAAVPSELRRQREASERVSELERQARAIERRGILVPQSLTSLLVEARAKKAEADFVIQASQQLDPWIYSYSQGWAVPPMVDPLLSTRAALASDALTSCIETMGRGVAGHGWEPVPRIGQAAYEKLEEAARKDIDEEKLRIVRWFTEANAEIPFVELYRRLVQAQETTGDGWLELLPDDKGSPCGLEFMPSYSMRLTPDTADVLCAEPVQMDDGSWGERLQYRRFRRVVQYINGRMVWFKLLGDPRFIDRTTGRVIGNELEARRNLGDAQAAARALRQAEVALEAVRRQMGAARGAPSPDVPALEELAGREVDAETRLRSAKRAAALLDPKRMEAEKVLAEIAQLRAENREAHEVLHLRHMGVSGGVTPYGVPRWYGATYSAIARTKQQQAGMLFWDGNAIPRLMISVEGAFFDPEQVKRIEDHFRNMKGIERMNDVLVVQAAASGPGSPDPYNEARGQVRIKVLKLNDAILDESSHRQSAKDWLNDVRRAFNLPPILTGDSDDYARAVADTARLIAEELVFQPERELFDHAINQLLFPRLGFRHWLFRTSGAHISDETTVVALLDLLHKSAGASTEELREFITSKLGKRLPPIGADWAQRVSLYNQALAQGGPQRDPHDPSEPLPEPVEEDEGDEDQGGGGKAGGAADDSAEIEADQAEEAADSPKGGKSPGKRREAGERVVEVPAELLQPAVLATAEGLVRLGEVVERVIRERAA